MMHQIVRKLTAKAYPVIQHANRTLQVAMIHFSRDVYRMLLNANDDIHAPFGIFHGATNMRKYLAALYRVIYQWSEIEKI